MVEYVAGFAFDNERTSVVLIHKEKPEWQKGKWNAVGGKVEAADKSCALAMEREFAEETGCAIPHHQWEYFASIGDSDQTWKVHFYRTFEPYSKLTGSITSKTNEEVKRFNLNCLPPNLMTNLRWLIQMALSMDTERAKAFEVNEIYT